MIGIEVLGASKRLMLPEIEHFMDNIDTHRATLAEELKAKRTQGSPINMPEQGAKVWVKEIGPDYVVVSGEKRETRRVNVRQLLAIHPNDPLIDNLRVMGNYPNNSAEVTKQ